VRQFYFVFIVTSRSCVTVKQSGFIALTGLGGRVSVGRTQCWQWMRSCTQDSSGRDCNEWTPCVSTMVPIRGGDHRDWSPADYKLSGQSSDPDDCENCRARQLPATENERRSERLRMQSGNRKLPPLLPLLLLLQWRSRSIWSGPRRTLLVVWNLSLRTIDILSLLRLSCRESPQFDTLYLLMSQKWYLWKNINS